MGWDPKGQEGRRGANGDHTEDRLPRLRAECCSGPRVRGDLARPCRRCRLYRPYSPFRIIQQLTRSEMYQRSRTDGWLWKG